MRLFRNFHSDFLRKTTSTIEFHSIMQYITSSSDFQTSPHFSKLNKILSCYVPNSLLPEVYVLLCECAHDIKKNSNIQDQLTQIQKISSCKPIDFLYLYIKKNEFSLALELLQQMIETEDANLTNVTRIEDLYLRMWTKCLPSLSLNDDADTKHKKNMLCKLLEELFNIAKAEDNSIKLKL